VHSNAYFYREMTFIPVNGEARTRQGKQLFTDRRPVILKTKRLNANMFYHMTAGNFEDETNSTQMSFVE